MAIRRRSKRSVKDVRVPVLFVLDMSGSMLFGKNGKSRLDHLNDMIKCIVEEFLKEADVRQYAEIGFMLFTHEIILESDFENIRWMSADMMPNPEMWHKDCGGVTWTKCAVEEYNEPVLVPQFEVSIRDYGTDINKAVVAAVKKLEDRVAELSEFGSFPPFMIMATDGDPDYGGHSEDEQEAIRVLRRHASTHRDENNLIFPFVVGIGSEEKDEDRLCQYVEHFKAGYFRIDDDASTEDWKYIAETLARSVSGSVSLNSFRFKNNSSLLPDLGKSI